MFVGGVVKFTRDTVLAGDDYHENASPMNKLRLDVRKLAAFHSSWVKTQTRLSFYGCHN